MMTKVRDSVMKSEQDSSTRARYQRLGDTTASVESRVGVFPGRFYPDAWVARAVLATFTTIRVARYVAMSFSILVSFLG